MQHLIKKSGQKITKKLISVSKDTAKVGKKHLKANVSAKIPQIRHIKLLIFEWSLLVAAIILLSIAQSFWYADSYSATVFTSGGSYTEATLGKISSINPLFAITSSEKTLQKLLFATFSASDYSGHIGPSLATSIKTDTIGKIWTVKLRDNLKWSDGHPITLQDVLFTINLIKNPKINTPYSSNFTGVTVEEHPDKLVFHLSSPYSSFPSALNFPVLPAHILKDVPPESLLEHEFSQKPITSGPFTFHASQVISETGEKIVYLNANPNYFKGRPLLNTFSIHAFPDLDSIQKALSTGSVTATAELPPTDQSKITNPDIFQKQTAISSGVFAFFNTKSPILKDASTRRAIRSGLDMRSLRAPLEEERPLDYPLIKERLPDLTPPPLPEFDSDAAKTTISELNQSPTLPVRIATVQNGYLPALAENLNFQLKKLGLHTELNVYEPNQDFIINIIRPRAYDILLYEIELGSDSDLFAYYHSNSATPTGFNLSNYSNYLVDDLILASRGIMDSKLRAAKYLSIIEHWLQDAPAIGIYQSNLSYFFNRNIRSFSEDNRLIYPTDRFTDITHWATQTTTKHRTP